MWIPALGWNGVRDIGFDITSFLMGKAAGGGGGGGGNPTVYEGTDIPSASLGSNGDVYIKYAVQGNSGLVDSQLGWACPPLYYATKANTEYGTIDGRWFKKSYDAPGIVCYALNTGSVEGASSPLTFPITISTTKNGASKIDGHSQQPTADQYFKSCTYGGLTWYFNTGYGMETNVTASGGQFGLQARINLPNTVTTWEEVCQYCLSIIGVQTGIATPGVYYIKANGAWVVQT